MDRRLIRQVPSPRQRAPPIGWRRNDCSPVVHIKGARDDASRATSKKWQQDEASRCRPRVLFLSFWGCVGKTFTVVRRLAHWWHRLVDTRQLTYSSRLCATETTHLLVKKYRWGPGHQLTHRVLPCPRCGPTPPTWTSSWRRSTGRLERRGTGTKARRRNLASFSKTANSGASLNSWRTKWSLQKVAGRCLLVAIVYKLHSYLFTFLIR